MTIEDVTIEDVLWATAIVFSRAFYLENVDVLLKKDLENAPCAPPTNATSCIEYELLRRFRRGTAREFVVFAFGSGDVTTTTATTG